MKIRATLWAAAVIGAALLDLRVALRGDLVPPTQADMTRAVEAINERRRPGDVLVHSPLFPVEAVAQLKDLPARPDLPSKDVRTGRRVLLLDYPNHPMYGFETPNETVSISDALVLEVYEPSGTASLTVYHLASQLSPDTLRVERPPGRTVSQCDRTRPEGGYACPGQPEWLYVAPRRLRIDGQETECVWVHPTTGGAMVLTIPALEMPPAGRQLELEVSAGLTDDAARGTPDGAPVKTEIRQGGRALATVTVPNRVGWFKKTVAIQPGQPIELSVTTLRDGRRHHCVRAQVVEGKGG